MKSDALPSWHQQAWTLTVPLQPHRHAGEDRNAHRWMDPHLLESTWLQPACLVLLSPFYTFVPYFRIFPRVQRSALWYAMVASRSVSNSFPADGHGRASVVFLVNTLSQWHFGLCLGSRGASSLEQGECTFKSEGCRQAASGKAWPVSFLTKSVVPRPRHQGGLGSTSCRLPSPQFPAEAHRFPYLTKSIFFSRELLTHILAHFPLLPSSVYLLIYWKQCHSYQIF